VTAYSGDLRDESLDGQRVVLGGIVTGVRSVMTKARATMAVVTLEDLQGTLEVVVFPKTYETTMGTWRDGAILLVAGRVDHRGEEASLLADSVWDWDAAEERGPEAFAREVGSLDKRARRGSGSGQNGGANGGQNGGANGRPNGRGTPATPVPTYSEPPDLVTATGAGGAEIGEEPPLPEEAGARVVADAQAPSRPIEAAPGAVLNVRFARSAGTDRVVSAMHALKSVLRERPGATRVVVHVPAPGGDALPMELRGVAYDAELISEVRRRAGDDVIDLRLA
jgi:hypothetical protein